jgi:hypothetical protein
MSSPTADGGMITPRRDFSSIRRGIMNQGARRNWLQVSCEKQIPVLKELSLMV